MSLHQKLQNEFEDREDLESPHMVSIVSEYEDMWEMPKETIVS